MTMPAVTTITDPSGTVWVLDGSAGIWEGQGKKGFHAPTYQHYRDDSPAVAGSFWRGVRTLPRDLFLPIVIRDTNRDNLLAIRRNLIKAISPTKGECIISSAWPDGSVRYIRCRYVEGMDAGEQGPGEYGVTVLRYGLRFMADDPYMYGEQINTSWSLTAQTRTELPMPGTDTFFEIVSSPLIAGGVVLSNIGDEDAYPSWQFNGPFSQIIAQNVTTGKSWTITHTAGGPSNALFLTTEPGESSLTDESGQNRWDKLNAGYQLWPLQSGNNTINITMTGASVDSYATLSYVPLYGGD